MKEQQLVELLQEMTVEEKVGQLIQLTPDFFDRDGGAITGPVQEWNIPEKQLFQMGSVLGTHTAEQVYKIQKNFLEKSRLKIPLMFMADVIHGFETIYPIPLALASTFDENLVEEVAHHSAAEASRAGIHVTFSPMADHVKDSRWGRVLESNGEDPTLSKALTKAYVRGYQGSDLANNPVDIAACVKHFIGYGASEAGRDYNAVDFSELEMYQNYLPAFEGAIEEDVKLVMTSFNTMSGMPVSGNRHLLQDVLRKRLGFEGVIISDWAAVAELMSHRVAQNSREAAELAFHAGVDIEMMSDTYLKNLKDLIITKEAEDALDQSVMRILILKNDLGLFENPFRGMDKISFNEEMQKELNKHVQSVAEKAAVLLKNEAVLPLKEKENVLLVGPKATSQDVLGAWAAIGAEADAISLAQGLQEKKLNLTVLGDADHLQEIIDAAKNAEKIVIAIGETSEEAGEAASKTALTLPKDQVELVKEISKVNSNIILVVYSGRPLVLTDVEPFVSGIVEAWFLGTQSGLALANLLVGQANFQGKLPMSFPRNTGQLPYSYREMSTGRALTEENKKEKYVSRYLDEKNDALYPFGYGLSYSEFQISSPILSSKEITSDEELIISVNVKNISDSQGVATIQLYIQDVFSEVVRPIKELLKWKQVLLQPQEEQTVQFTILEKDLRYVHADLERRSDSGEFKIFIGQDSRYGLQTDSFHLKVLS